MKKRIICLSSLSAMLLTLMTSCVNNDYDLSDIDTNVRLQVNNLTIPVNIEPLKLDDMLDIEDGDRIEKMTVDGQEIYAVVEKGTFESGEISINEMVISKPTLPEISDNLEVKAGDKLNAIPATYDAVKFSEIAPLMGTLGLSEETQLVHFAITDVHKTIEFNANVDQAVTAIGHLGVQTNFSITLAFPGTEDYVSSYQIKGLKVYLPKGLETTNTNYNKETGVFAIDEINAGEDQKVTIELPLTGIDPVLAESTFEDHKFGFKQDVSAEGEINFFVKNINPSVTIGTLRNFKEIAYACNAGFTEDIAVKTFTGGIKYVVDSPNISPVNLSDLPDLLTQTGTKIEMANPQIYVNVKNPIDEKFGIKPKATLTLVPNIINEYGPFVQTVEMNKANTVLCLSPSKPATYAEGYENAEYQAFANLGKILACNGGNGYQMPTSLSITVDPVVEQNVTDFELKSFGKVTGNYSFVAPLALTDESVICYDKTWDDWDSEDLDGLTVQSAVVTATVSSDIPAEITSETVAYLLGKDANGNTVRMKGTTSLPANAKDYALEIKLGEGQSISRIYGMELKVRATGGNAALTPTQNIVVKDLKATFSGYYDKEL